MPTITLPGDCAWVKNASTEIYGGHLEKKDRGGSGGDPRTTTSAAQYCQLTEDVSAVVQTASTVTITLQLVNDDVATIVTHKSMLGEPVITYPDDGYFLNVLTWESSYTNAYGSEGATNLTQYVSSVHNSTARQMVVGEFTSANAFKFKVLDSADSPILDAKVTIWFS